MSIEEAEEILNEAVISEPSIMSYTYISADEINNAIDKVLEEREVQKNKIKQLEENIILQKEKTEKIIKERKKEEEKSKIQIFNNKYLYDKYIKRVVRPIFY